MREQVPILLTCPLNFQVQDLICVFSIMCMLASVSFINLLLKNSEL